MPSFLTPDERSTFEVQNVLVSFTPMFPVFPYGSLKYPCPPALLLFYCFSFVFIVVEMDVILKVNHTH